MILSPDLVRAADSDVEMDMFRVGDCGNDTDVLYVAVHDGATLVLCETVSVVVTLLLNEYSTVTCGLGECDFVPAVSVPDSENDMLIVDVFVKERPGALNDQLVDRERVLLRYPKDTVSLKLVEGVTRNVRVNVKRRLDVPDRTADALVNVRDSEVWELAVGVPVGDSVAIGVVVR